MNTLDTDICRLISETSLAAVNHGFIEQVETIRTALPYLIKDSGDRQILEAALLIGLKQVDDALKLLANNSSDEANTLRRLIESDPVRRCPSPVQAYTHPLLG
ncbi:EscG/YscG/SsaH family type III secretion system needle protein co-chaperone [Pseudomonas sp. 6D_7.1_Bac1]|uniref:EscG/YscG/SsaH family type III secretion system needle protein co-chaperone n=1 Tax=Pseudomonas sp. 6D_7.1_Bac1 TaxID=2971615 RepID=UPI0021C58AEA|nr:EscG/YscG/SsaH family type III secretion system needle protein co-chaperone [Pseudomonas sp. 6D_7.1_Bac1]MCU1748816.1 EscG/YscG/SsaH family type III secretion system needle protein co-chaperone [Pseudomonas sp. 6D_7.1_Bac1]